MSQQIPRLFISYSRSDRAFADMLVKYLSEMYGNENVFYDQQVTGGDDWWKTILTRIAECDIFIYLLSPRSVNSPYCKAEYEEAQRLQKQIIPVRIKRRFRPQPGGLGDIQHIHLTNPQNAGPLTQLAGAIREQFAKRQTSPQKPLSETPISRPSLPSKKSEKIAPKLQTDETLTFIPTRTNAALFIYKTIYRILSDPVMQGIGVVVGILSVLIALITLFVTIALAEGTQEPTSTPIVETLTITVATVAPSPTPTASPTATTCAEQAQCLNVMLSPLITHEQYRRCTDARGCNQNQFTFGDLRYDPEPVIGVTWLMAQQYCISQGGRLPTAAEWEALAQDTQAAVVREWTATSEEGINYSPYGPADGYVPMSEMGVDASMMIRDIRSRTLLVYEDSDNANRETGFRCAQ